MVVQYYNTQLGPAENHSVKRNQNRIRSKLNIYILWGGMDKFTIINSAAMHRYKKKITLPIPLLCCRVRYTRQCILRRSKRPKYTPFARRPRRDLFAKRRLVEGVENWQLERHCHSVVYIYGMVATAPMCTVVGNNIPTTLHTVTSRSGTGNKVHTHTLVVYLYVICTYYCNLYLNYCSNVIRLIQFRWQSLGVRGAGQVTVISRLIISRLRCHVAVAAA